MVVAVCGGVPWLGQIGFRLVVDNWMFGRRFPARRRSVVGSLQRFDPGGGWVLVEREAVYKGVSNRELGRHDLNGRYSPLGKHAHDEDFSSHELSTCHDRYGSAYEEVVICHGCDMNQRYMPQRNTHDEEVCNYENGGKYVRRRNTLDEEVNSSELGGRYVPRRNPFDEKVRNYEISGGYAPRRNASDGQQLRNWWKICASKKRR
ncbi:hypothetical protein L484_010280 [Morus notabilis]|uniref:Uncharacterized protein n=1 Tax=Morus notabilis TaxID=981085 RepID=W9QMW4_9ROSA|nr:hypothetical protein L484_010280 [Morus notabilis]